MNHNCLNLALAMAVGFLCNACTHEAIIPDGKNVTVQREPVNSKCAEIGKVQGSVATTTGTIEQAIEDMKLDASRQGANYVHMESTGAMGTSVSGIAYHCP